MNRIDRIKGREVGIIGMARSGIAAARLVLELEGKPFVSDVLPAEKLGDVIAVLDQHHIPFECGGHTERLLQCDYLILSPGVPASLDILQKAAAAGIPLIGNILFT